MYHYLHLITISMNCPICKKSIQGNLLLDDILFDHISSGECDLDAFSEDSLDLCEFLPNNMLHTIEVCSKLKTLRNLYITQQYSS